MAEVKISELTSATTPLAGTEVVPIVQGGVTKKVSVSEIGGGGGTEWGAITGDLFNQTDLQAQLDSKQDYLFSGTNIKTISQTSILGSGNLQLSKTVALNTTLTSIPSVAAETLIASALIPANTLQSASVLNLIVKAGNVGSGASATIKIYLNTSNSLTGATLIGTGSTTSGVGTFERNMLVNNTILYTMNVTSVSNLDFNGFAQSSITINRANTYYLICSISNSSPSTSNIYGIKLTENA
jgi:hypothetical protein